MRSFILLGKWLVDEMLRKCIIGPDKKVVHSVNIPTILNWDHKTFLGCEYVQTCYIQAFLYDRGGKGRVKSEI